MGRWTGLQRRRRVIEMNRRGLQVLAVTSRRRITLISRQSVKPQQSVVVFPATPQSRFVTTDRFQRNFVLVFTSRRLAKRGICRRRVSVCVCVCLSHSGIVSKRLNVGSRKRRRTMAP